MNRRDDGGLCSMDNDAQICCARFLEATAEIAKLEAQKAALNVLLLDVTEKLRKSYEGAA